jgi:hypothetical protein
VSGPHLPNIDQLVIDTGFGIRQTGRQPRSARAGG